jgi:signal-transduction protein with cAMP-binding, CBS, and nucleotidyltransferase domain
MIDTSVLESIPVGGVMTTDFDRVEADMPLREAVALIRARRGAALVVDAGDDSPSIISEFDIVKAIDDHGSLDGLTVADRRTKIAVAGEPSWTLGHALDTMLRGGFRHLIVMENGDVVGMMRMRDIIRRLTAGSYHVEPGQDTVEFSAQVAEDTTRLIKSFRRSAKQHWVAIKCPCELDWVEILIDQAETRDDLTSDEILALWEQRQPCPALHEGGAGD